MRRKITTLREERAACFEKQKAISEKAEAEGRDLTAEESQEYQAIGTEFDSLTSRIERLEREAGVAPEMTREVAIPEEEPTASVPEARTAGRPTETPEYREAFDAYMRSGIQGLDALTSEQRAALQVNTASEGGYTVPVAFLEQLLESRREFGVIDGLATHFATDNAGQVQVPTIATYGTSVLTAEEAAFTESEDTFGQVTMDAYKYGRIEKISDELITDSVFDVLGIVATLAGQSLAIVTGAAYAVGTGSSQPNGLFTAAANGKTAASPTAITADELIDLYHSVLSPYRASASWIIRDATAALVRKLKDTTNQYLWQPGLQAGQPDTLLGRPVHTDPNAPAATTGQKSVLFGDVSKYWIRDVQGTTVKVLNELYAANGQVGFRIHMRTDGDLVDANAVKVLTQA